MNTLKKLFHKNYHYVFLLFSMFPLIPNKFKGLPVILLFIFTLFNICDRKEKYPLKDTIISTSLYWVLLISLIYTTNFYKVDRQLTTRLSLLIVPISFGILKKSGYRIEKGFLNKFINRYILFSLLFSLFILMYSLYLNLHEGLIMNEIYTNLNEGMFGWQQHPIYSSIFFGLAVLFILNFLIKKEIQKRRKIVYSIALILITSVLIFLARKGVLLALLICIVFVSMRYIKRGYLKIFFVVSFFVFCISLWQFPTIKSRFSEIFRTNTYTKVDENNSTSIRKGIYDCATLKIKESPIFGYGMGDIQDQLNLCYKSRKYFTKGITYNSHNQYLSYYLSSGVLGLLAICFFVFYFTSFAIKKHKILLAITLVFYAIIMLFENTLERQSGVILFSFLTSFFYYYENED